MGCGGDAVPGCQLLSALSIRIGIRVELLTRVSIFCYRLTRLFRKPLDSFFLNPCRACSSLISRLSRATASASSSGPALSYPRCSEAVKTELGSELQCGATFRGASALPVSFSTLDLDVAHPLPDGGTASILVAAAAAHQWRWCSDIVPLPAGLRPSSPCPSLQPKPSVSAEVFACDGRDDRSVTPRIGPSCPRPVGMRHPHGLLRH